MFYFLFGSEPVRQFEENCNVEDVTSKEGEVYKYDEGQVDSPSVLLSAYHGWGAFYALEEDEYEALLKHFKS